MFRRLQERLGKTRNSFVSQLDQLFLGKKAINQELFDELEELLITADLGVNTTMELLESYWFGCCQMFRVKKLDIYIIRQFFALRSSDLSSKSSWLIAFLPRKSWSSMPHYGLTMPDSPLAR